MKVKPWATTEETLAALHTTLLARRGCDIFWGSLRVLLETLARDLKKRQEASPGTLVDNELLDGERYATLLDEIRAALARQTAEPATFRRLASALSAPALGLLLLLGGVASVGCDHTGLHRSAPSRDAEPPASVDTNVVQPVSQPDAAISIALPDAPPVRGVVDARVAGPEAGRDVLPVSLMSPDAALATDLATAARRSDGAAVTIQDIMDSCNISDQQQQQLHACLATLGGSWGTFLAEGFAGANCSFVESQLGCLDESQLCGGFYMITSSKGSLDPNTPWICQAVLMYLGVRFV
jgi:hypothetical protein